MKVVRLLSNVRFCARCCRAVESYSGPRLDDWRERFPKRHSLFASRLEGETSWFCLQQRGKPRRVSALRKRVVDHSANYLSVCPRSIPYHQRLLTRLLSGHLLLKRGEGALSREQLAHCLPEPRGPSWTCPHRPSGDAPPQPVHLLHSSRLPALQAKGRPPPQQQLPLQDKLTPSPTVIGLSSSPFSPSQVKESNLTAWPVLFPSRSVIVHTVAPSTLNLRPSLACLTPSSP